MWVLFAHLEEMLAMNCKILEPSFCLLIPLTKLHGIIAGQAWLIGLTFCLCFINKIYAIMSCFTEGYLGVLFRERCLDFWIGRGGWGCTGLWDFLFLSYFDLFPFWNRISIIRLEKFCSEKNPQSFVAIAPSKLFEYTAVKGHSKWENKTPSFEILVFSEYWV